MRVYNACLTTELYWTAVTVIRSMFREIEADCYLMIDGDDTYSAEEARKMADLILHGGYDMVIGDRLSSTYFKENKRPFHNTGNLLVRRLVNQFFHGNVTDIMTGHRAFSRLFVKTFPVLSTEFEIETEMTIHALDKNLAITSVEVNYRDRPEGSKSKLNTFSDGIKVLKTIARLFRDYKPMPFFGTLSALIAIIAVIMVVPVLTEYIRTGPVPRLPTFVASCFLMMSAMMSLSVGLVLDTQTKLSRQNYELQMNRLLKKEHTDRD